VEAFDFRRVFGDPCLGLRALRMRVGEFCTEPGFRGFRGGKLCGERVGGGLGFRLCALRGSPGGGDLFP